jgi:hypothetical protein
MMLLLSALLLATPCSANADARQFDYWLGHWNVAGGGTSTVSLSLDQCLLTERWETGKGLRGQNVFAYDPDDQQWHGLYVDNQGRVHVLQGRVTPGVAEFEGPGRGPNGEPVLNRIRITRLNANAVEQTWEKSLDHGTTWTMEFRGSYARTTSS